MSAFDPKRTWAARLGISERQFSIQKCDILLIPDVVLGKAKP